ncbi:MAG: endonuclease/exonuclease/phosphatase family protein [Thermodesulfobacteriota bacterium]
MKGSHQNTDRVSVMSINVRFGLADADAGEHSWKNRKPAFINLFEKYRPDFIGMQEVNGFQAAFFTEILSGYSAIGKRSPAPAHWQDVLIFHNKRWRCIDHLRFFLSDTPDIPSRMARSRWPRQCVMGKFEKNGVRMVCANTHFDFDEQVQVRSAAILTEHMERFAADAPPAVITGDFNAGPDSACHKAFIGPAPDRRPFSDAFDGDTAGTFHKFTGEPVSERIDWILFQGLADPVKKELITSRFSGVFPSDHFPVYAEFGLPL